MRKTYIFWAASLALVLFMGCSTRTRNIETETVYEPARDSESAGEGSVINKTESRETRTETLTEPSGLLSGTVDLVGKTIALPFRIAGGLIDLAF